MAHSLKLRVIAEGVETEKQLAFVCEQGCNELQGFLFSCPLPAGEAFNFMSKEKQGAGICAALLRRVIGAVPETV